MESLSSSCIPLSLMEINSHEPDGEDVQESDFNSDSIPIEHPSNEVTTKIPNMGDIFENPAEINENVEAIDISGHICQQFEEKTSQYLGDGGQVYQNTRYECIDCKKTYTTFELNQLVQDREANFNLDEKTDDGQSAIKPEIPALELGIPSATGLENKQFETIATDLEMISAHSGNESHGIQQAMSLDPSLEMISVESDETKFLIGEPRIAGFIQLPAYTQLETKYVELEKHLKSPSGRPVIPQSSSTSQYVVTPSTLSSMLKTNTTAVTTDAGLQINELNSYINEMDSHSDVPPNVMSESTEKAEITSSNYTNNSHPGTSVQQASLEDNSNAQMYTKTTEALETEKESPNLSNTHVSFSKITENQNECKVDSLSTQQKALDKLISELEHVSNNERKGETQVFVMNNSERDENEGYFQLEDSSNPEASLSNQIDQSKSEDGDTTSTAAALSLDSTVLVQNSTNKDVQKNNHEVQNLTTDAEHSQRKILKGKVVCVTTKRDGRKLTFYQCSKCQVAFTSQDSLEKHFLHKHSAQVIEKRKLTSSFTKEEQQFDASKRNKSQILLINGKNIYVCYCQLRFATLQSFQEHLSVNECDKATKTKLMPKENIDIHYTAPKFSANSVIAISNSSQGAANTSNAESLKQSGEIDDIPGTCNQDLNEMTDGGDLTINLEVENAAREENKKCSSTNISRLEAVQTEHTPLQEISEIADAVILENGSFASQTTQFIGSHVVRQGLPATNRSNSNTCSGSIDKEILSITCIRCSKSYSCSPKWNYTGPLQCSSCRWSFESPPHLQCHYDHFHMIADTKCPLCPYVSNRCSASVMDNHFKTVHPNKEIFHCYLCEATFTTRACLRNHVTRHFQQKGEYECPHCHMKFDKEMRLNIHKVRNHSILLGVPKGGVMPPTQVTLYMCGVCGRQYEYEGTLRMHLKTHSENDETAGVSL